MKNLSIIFGLGLLLSLQANASETALLCNDQNSHAVYRLILSEDLRTTKLVTAIADSSVLSAGSNELKFLEGESSPQVATFAGNSKLGLIIVLLYNRQKATELNSAEILEVDVAYQQFKGDYLSGKTDLLCSKQ